MGIRSYAWSALRRARFAFHGRYCGPGNSGPGEPVDALDSACRVHDAAYQVSYGDPEADAALVAELRRGLAVRAYPWRIRWKARAIVIVFSLRPSVWRRLRGMEDRPLTLKAQDPVALLITAALAVSAEIGAFDGYSASLVVQVGALLMAVAAIGRHLMERRRDASLAQVFATIADKVPEAKAALDEIRQQRKGALGEGGQVEGVLEGDTTPIEVDPKRKSRRGLSQIRVLVGIVIACLTVLMWAGPNPWAGVALVVACGVIAADIIISDARWSHRKIIGYASFPILAVLLSGCAGLSGYQKPGLGDLVARVDLTRVVECWQQPTPRDKARCLGLEALSQGVDLALNEAGKLADAALAGANPGAGAADMSARDERKLARETNAALDRLAHEITLAQ